MQPQISSPTTTIRRYSLAVEADNRRQAALNEWKAAAEAMLTVRNAQTEQRLIEAAAAFKQANNEYHAVVKKVFPQ